MVYKTAMPRNVLKFNQNSIFCDLWSDIIEFFPWAVVDTAIKYDEQC